MIEVRGISKRFGGVLALDNVSLAAADGEVLAIIGENGAGKSTLMKILAGVHRPDDGQTLLDGNSVEFGSPAESLRAGICVIYQELSVLENLDVTGNVFLGREKRRLLGSLNERAMRKETARILARLNVDISATRRVAELSLAERQLVEILRALSMKVRVLVLDEPTSSLTTEETAKLFRLVRELKAHGVTVLYVSHRLDEVRQLADRVVALRDGRLAGELVGDKIEHDAMVRLMVGRSLEAVSDAGTSSWGRDRLDIRGLRTYRFPQHSVDLSVRSGEVLAIAGLVGSGRTELVEAVFGIRPAIAGEVGLDGERARIGCPRDAIDIGIRLIPEDRRRNGLSLGMTVRENISLPWLSSFVRSGIVRRRAETRWAQEQSSRFGVKASSIESPAENLSGGNQQKVVLARWLSKDPKVILFDEPTRGVDVGARSAIWEEMRALARAHAAIAMVSSDMEEVLAVADRIAVMRQGRLVGILSRQEATEERIMALAVGKHED